MNKIHFEKDLVNFCKCIYEHFIRKLICNQIKVNKMMSCNSSQVIIASHNCQIRGSSRFYESSLESLCHWDDGLKNHVGARHCRKPLGRRKWLTIFNTARFTKIRASTWCVQILSKYFCYCRICQNYGFCMICTNLVERFLVL